jgi:hypothetical protein
MALTSRLTAIADAIRSKTGGTAKLTLAQMPTEIAGIKVRLADYAGNTGVTPTEDAQTLATKDTSVTSDITVAAIPTGYVDLSKAVKSSTRLYLRHIVVTDTTDGTAHTATVTVDGKTLDADGIAKIGTLTWYEGGTAKGTGGTYTASSSTATVTCRLEM